MKSIKHCRIHVTRTQLAESQAPYAKIVRDSTDVHKIAASIVAHEDQEVFLVFFLDAKNKITGYSEIARGTISYCPIAMREAFRGAIIQGAVAVIFVHNHPSGDPTPSSDDIEITRKLCRAGSILGIDVRDHIVIGHNNSYTSFCDKGLLGG